MIYLLVILSVGMFVDSLSGHHSLEELEFVVWFGAIVQDETKIDGCILGGYCCSEKAEEDDVSAADATNDLRPAFAKLIEFLHGLLYIYKGKQSMKSNINQEQLLICLSSSKIKGSLGG